MEFKGTKGKWIFRKNGLNTIKVLGRKTKKVCEINCNLNNKLDDINFANAKLIASAPEMFEMLKELIRCNDLGHQIGQFDKAQELLTKITE
jgi:hypothetical protein